MKLVFNMGIIVPEGTLPDGEKLMVILPYFPGHVSLTLHLETLRNKLRELRDDNQFHPDMQTYICMYPDAHSFAGALMIVEAFRSFNNWPEIWIADGRRVGEWIQTNRFIGEGMDWAQTYQHDTNEFSIVDYITQTRK
jgi:hypothetical protein